jgi:hypothetical protein
MLAVCRAVNYTVTFRTLNCDSGLPLLTTEASSESVLVSVEHTVAAPQALRGSILVSFMGSHFAEVALDANDPDMEAALVSLGIGS